MNTEIARIVISANTGERSPFIPMIKVVLHCNVNFFCAFSHHEIQFISMFCIWYFMMMMVVEHYNKMKRTKRNSHLYLKISAKKPTRVIAPLQGLFFIALRGSLLFLLYSFRGDVPSFFCMNYCLIRPLKTMDWKMKNYEKKS